MIHSGECLRSTSSCELGVPQCFIGETRQREDLSLQGNKKKGKWTYVVTWKTFNRRDESVDENTPDTSEEGFPSESRIWLFQEVSDKGRTYGWGLKCLLLAWLKTRPRVAFGYLIPVVLHGTSILDGEGSDNSPLQEFFYNIYYGYLVVIEIVRYC